jgi:hypothetical protein
MKKLEALNRYFGARSRVVLPACPFDVGAMPLGRRVVQGGRAAGRWEFVGSSHPEAQSDGADLEPECGEEVILGSTAVVDSCSTDPTGGGPPPSGDDDTNNQPLEPPSIQPWRGSARVPTQAASMPDGIVRATSRSPGGLCRRHRNRAPGKGGGFNSHSLSTVSGIVRGSISRKARHRRQGHPGRRPLVR